MNRGRKAAIGLATVGAIWFPTVALAPAAHAGTENYIQIKNNAAFVADTCYRWRSHEEKNYCHNAYPVGQSRTAYFPEGETGAIIELYVWPGTKPWTTEAVTDTNRNHCFEISGSALNPTLLETGC